MVVHNAPQQALIIRFERDHIAIIAQRDQRLLHDF
jgi:hypothetical protein